MDSFLRSRTTSNVSECTHLSLIGGKYKIPYHDFDHFYKLYVNEVNNSRELFLVERVRYPCYLFIDLDGVNKSVLDDLVHRKNVYVSLRKSDEATTGIHIIYKDIIVNNFEEAVAKSSELSLNGLDTSVYRSGLRMMGSSKKRGVSRIYKPFKIQEDGLMTVDDMYENSLLIFNESVNLPIAVKKSIIHLPKNSGETTSNGYDFSNIHINYKNTQVTNISKIKDYHIIQTREHFCTNIDREHKSNHVYFVVTKNKQIYQKCFDTECKTFTGMQKPVSIKLFYSLKNIK